MARTLLAIMAFALISAAVSARAAPPSTIKARYVVYKDGLLVGTAEESYQ